ncbi:MAG: type I-MYXAN CRISPR-associated protein Cas6/Cmx6, partial [Nitrososphaera sp.]|nr:type I-MYXAN CRISPR-associated protein Cas6/Cmx6 [Nitrososphaera sp.]
MVVLDISFRVEGTEIPADHSYILLSALSRIIPELHGDQSVGIHPISGVLLGDRLLRLTGNSSLVLRVPHERLSLLVCLSGKRLDLNGHTLTIGMPTPRILKPVAALRSRLVVIKGFTEHEGFIEACRRQLELRDIKGEVNIPLKQQSSSFEGRTGASGNTSLLLRRTIMIHDKVVVGYAIQVAGLSPDDSIRLQEFGLGG